MGMSIRAYARHRGVTDTAVHKAIRTGRITPEPDGTLDPVRADQEWAQNTQVLQTGSRQRAVQVAPEDTPASGATTGGGTSLLQARTVNEVVNAQTNKVRLARLKGELVDRAQVITHIFQLARTERDAWLNWPARIAAPMAAALGIESQTLHLALDQAVRDHLKELGELRPQID